jgi:serine/threonine protein kinase
MIGEPVGNYIIDAEVGKSAMCRVFRAHPAYDPTRCVALKLLTHDKAGTAEFAKQFLAQIELLRRLQHPAIVTVQGGGEHQGKPFYTTEWVEGPTFEAILRQGERPSWKEVLVIALQIVPALRHAHRRSVLHRDIKPGNLFRAGPETYKLSDFGVMKFFGDSLITHSDNILGSPAYLSPETAAGKPHTKRSDFYSLGALLYTLLVGRPPFTGQTVVELIHKHCFILPERPIHFLRELPEELDRLIMKLLAKDPSHRPGSGTLLIHEFEALWSMLERRGLLAKRPATAAIPGTDDDAAPLEEENHQLTEKVFEPIPAPLVPWHRKPLIVLPMFCFCVGLLIWAFYFRGAGPDDLMSRAKPLLESNDPADWQRAWDEYLEPLSRKFPDRYVDEVKEARRRIDEQGEIRRALAAGRVVKYHSEAERFYYEGLRLSQSGEFTAARQVWQNVVQVFGNTEAEKHWVQLAGIAVENLRSREDPPLRPSTTMDLKTTLQPIIAEVHRLRHNGKLKEADTIQQALKNLYRDDPERAKIVDWLHE